MSGKSLTTQANGIQFVETGFLIGGLTLILSACGILFAGHAFHRESFLSVQHLKGIVFAVAFGSVNLRSWRLLLDCFFAETPGGDQRASIAPHKHLWALAVKLVVLTIGLIFLISGMKSEITAALLGFALYIVLGSLVCGGGFFYAHYADRKQLQTTSNGRINMPP